MERQKSMEWQEITEQQELMREIQQCNTEMKEKILYMAEAIYRYRHDEKREERIWEALRNCIEP